MAPQETAAFPLREAYPFAEASGLGTESSEIRDMEIEWGRRGGSRVRRGRMIQLFEQHGLMKSFISKHWPAGSTPAGEARRRGCLRIADEYERFQLEGGASDEEASEDSSSFEFALEAHLRDFLARNLNQIEAGLRLFEQDGRSGVEFPVDGGRIDILAVDRDGKYVAIELKLAQGRNRALGQLLYYMGWIDRNLGREPCRGIVIASEISEELTIAVSRAPGVGLYRYRMNFSLERAGAQTV